MNELVNAKNKDIWLLVGRSTC